MRGVRDVCLRCVLTRVRLLGPLVFCSWVIALLAFGRPAQGPDSWALTASNSETDTLSDVQLCNNRVCDAGAAALADAPGPAATADVAVVVS